MKIWDVVLLKYNKMKIGDVVLLKSEFNFIVNSTSDTIDRENKIIEDLQTLYPTSHFQIKHDRLGEVKKYRVKIIHNSVIFKYQFSKFKIIVISI